MLRRQLVTGNMKLKLLLMLALFSANSIAFASDIKCNITFGNNSYIELEEGASHSASSVSIESISFTGHINSEQAAYLHYWRSNDSQGISFKTSDGNIHDTASARNSVVKFKCGLVQNIAAVVYHHENKRGRRIYLGPGDQFDLAKFGQAEEISSIEVKPGYRFEYTIDSNDSNAFQEPIFKEGDYYAGNEGNNPEQILSNNGISRHDNINIVKVSHYISPQTMTLRNGADTSLCLEVVDGNYYNGANVRAGSCSGGNHQKWEYNALTQRLSSNGFCLDMFSNYDEGGQMGIWSCVNVAHSDLENQQWYWDATGTVLASRRHDRVAEYVAQNDDILQKTFNGSKSQQWFRGANNFAAQMVIINFLLDEDDLSEADLKQLSDSIDHGKSFLSTIKDTHSLPHNIMPIDGDYIIEEGDGEWVGLKLIDSTLHIYKKGSQLPSAENIADFFAELFIRGLFPNNLCVQKYSHGFIQNRTPAELLTSADKDELKQWEENGVLEECSIALTFEPSLSFSIRNQKLNTSDYLDALEAFHQPVQGSEFRSRKLGILSSFDSRIGTASTMRRFEVSANAMVRPPFYCDMDAVDPRCTNYIAPVVIDIATNNDSGLANSEGYYDAIDLNPIFPPNGRCYALQFKNGKPEDVKLDCTERVYAMCQGAEDFKLTQNTYTLGLISDNVCVQEYGVHSRTVTRKRAREEGIELLKASDRRVAAKFKNDEQSGLGKETLDFLDSIKTKLKLDDERKSGLSVLQIHSLNIGAGSCHLVQCFGPLAEGELLPPPSSFLFDCGSSGSDLKKLNATDVGLYLQSQQVNAGPFSVAVSHSDQDHFNYLTSNITIAQVNDLWLGGDIKNRNNYTGSKASSNFSPYIHANITNFERINGKPGLEFPGFQPGIDYYGVNEENFRSALPEWTKPTINATEITSFEACHTTLSLLNVNQSKNNEGSPRIPNADSAVLLLKTNRQKITDGSTTTDILSVFSADAEGATESYARSLLPNNSADYKTRLVTASHHGANTYGSNSEKWINALNPTDVVFSSGTRNAHPRADVVEKYLEKVKKYNLSFRDSHKLYHGYFENWVNESDDTRVETRETIYSTASSGTIVYTFVIPNDSDEELIKFIDIQYTDPMQE